jgi:hypothetical protein
VAGKKGSSIQNYIGDCAVGPQLIAVTGFVGDKKMTDAPQGLFERIEEYLDANISGSGILWNEEEIKKICTEFEQRLAEAEEKYKSVGSALLLCKEQLDATRAACAEDFAAIKAAGFESPGELLAAWENLHKQEPVAYRYRFSDPISGKPVWRSDFYTWNGQKYEESEALYTHPAPQAEQKSLKVDADEIALKAAQEIALMWGHDRSQFVSKIQCRIIEAIAEAEPVAVPEGWKIELYKTRKHFLGLRIASPSGASTLFEEEEGSSNFEVFKCFLDDLQKAATKQEAKS